MSKYYEYFDTTIEDLMREEGSRYDYYNLCAYGRYDVTKPSYPNNTGYFYLGSLKGFKDSIKNEEVFFVDEDAKEICLIKELKDLELEYKWSD